MSLIRGDEFANMLVNIWTFVYCSLLDLLDALLGLLDAF
jgi:hypothetical protein